MLHHRIIGPGNIYVSEDPLDMLVAYGIGSCLGVGMIDPKRHIGGMAHAVLPGSMNGTISNSLNFVDYSIYSLFRKMASLGSKPKDMTVCLVGGADMLLTQNKVDHFDHGTKNVQSAYHALSKLDLPVYAQEIGGNVGRTFRIYINDGRMTCRVIGGTEKILVKSSYKEIPVSKEKSNV